MNLAGKIRKHIQALALSQGNQDVNLPSSDGHICILHMVTTSKQRQVHHACAGKPLWLQDPQTPVGTLAA